ncbi:MAG: malate dehydrogenase [Dehalococcoidia bacterium]|nr:malate dehydrogenase [Dehalococcoidia bacterium]
MRKKVTVVGGGNVGATAAQRIAERDYADVVLVDVVEGMPQGKALDLAQSGPVLGYDSAVTGANSYETTANSDIVVITAGIARRPGMTRDDLLRTNMGIMDSVVSEVVASSPDSILLVVSNPLDAMVYHAHKLSGFPKERVVGMAGVLDTARMRTFIAQELNVSVEDVNAYVLGGHGDTMVPLVRYTTVGGIPLENWLPQDRVEAIVQRTRDGGGEIVSLLKTGSAYYAPSAAVLQMVDSILLDKRRIVPAAAYLEGEYGVNGVFIGVPVILGANGVEKVIELELTDEEQAGFQKSVDAVNELVEAMANLGD